MIYLRDSDVYIGSESSCDYSDAKEFIDSLLIFHGYTKALEILDVDDFSELAEAITDDHGNADESEMEDLLIDRFNGEYVDSEVNDGLDFWQDHQIDLSLGK